MSKPEDQPIGEGATTLDMLKANYAWLGPYIEAQILAERMRCVQDVLAEPEYPGDMPEPMYAAITKLCSMGEFGKESVQEAFRIAARDTKQGIALRIAERNKS